MTIEQDLETLRAVLNSGALDDLDDLRNAGTDALSRIEADRQYLHDALKAVLEEYATFNDWIGDIARQALKELEEK